MVLTFDNICHVLQFDDRITGANTIRVHIRQLFSLIISLFSCVTWLYACRQTSDELHKYAV